jgi:hypothetical protein
MNIYLLAWKLNISVFEINQMYLNIFSNMWTHSSSGKITLISIGKKTLNINKICDTYFIFCDKLYLCLCNSKLNIKWQDNVEKWTI